MLSTVLAAINERDDNVDVSASGLVIGLILGVIIYLVADFAARQTGTPVLRVVGAVVGLVVFFLLGFDLHGVD